MFGGYGLIVGWSGNTSVRRVTSGIVQQGQLRKPWGFARFLSVRFQPGGRRALIFGRASGNPPVGSVTEYRHGAPDDMALNSVPINNFGANPYNASSNFYFFDAAFRPGCDEGFLVGHQQGQELNVGQISN